MTIASDRGFVVGEEYLVVSETCNGDRPGDRVRFVQDDGTDCPWFVSVGRVGRFTNEFSVKLHRLAPLQAPGGACIPDVENGAEKFDPPRKYILTHYNEETRYRAVTRLDVVEGILFVYYGDEDLDIYKDWQGITAV